MSSSGISFGGLASGLDTKAIISALMALERRPVDQLEVNKKSLERQKSLFGDFENLLNKLKTTAEAIRKTASFIDYKADVDDDTYLTASAGSSATPGSYNIEVVSLAKAEVVSSSGRASRDEAVFAGEGLIFTIGSSTKIVSIGTDTSLQGVANAINSSEAAEHVQAQVLNTGDPNNPWKLVVSGKQPGAANAFSVTADGGNAALNALAAELNGTPTVAASDAVLKIDGIEIRRTTNVITDAIAGLTLNLKGEHGTNPPTKVTITANAETTSKKVKDFVDAYNGVVDFVLAQSKVDDKGTASGPLFGDSTLRSVRSSLRDIVGSTVGSTSAGTSMLALVGVTSDRDGKLTFEQSKFDAKLNDDPAGVRTLFAHESTGVASRVFERIKTWTDGVEGLFKTRKDGFDTRLRQTNSNIERGERRLVMIEEQLNKRFAALETQLGRLQSQGGALGALNSLGTQNRR